MRSFIVPGLPTHSVQELNVGTVVVILYNQVLADVQSTDAGIKCFSTVLSPYVNSLTGLWPGIRPRMIIQDGLSCGSCGGSPGVYVNETALPLLGDIFGSSTPSVVRFVTITVFSAGCLNCS